MSLAETRNFPRCCDDDNDSGAAPAAASDDNDDDDGGGGGGADIDDDDDVDDIINSSFCFHVNLQLLPHGCPARTWFVHYSLNQRRFPCYPAADWLKATTTLAWGQIQMLPAHRQPLLSPWDGSGSLFVIRNQHENQMNEVRHRFCRVKDTEDAHHILSWAVAALTDQSHQNSCGGNSSRYDVSHSEMTCSQHTPLPFSFKHRPATSYTHISVTEVSSNISAGLAR